MVSDTRLQGHWNQLRGRLKRQWGEITDDEFQQAEGNMEHLVGLIQQKTGQARDSIEHKLDEMLRSFESTGQDSSEQIRTGYNQGAGRSFEGSDDLSERFSEGYERATELVQSHPAESLAVAFGTGLLTGVIAGLIIRSARD
jgi:uncharacterized protein YjbJ (UPF0337 family)